MTEEPAEMWLTKGLDWIVPLARQHKVKLVVRHYSTPIIAEGNRLTYSGPVSPFRRM
jgi:hypothetical protein